MKRRGACTVTAADGGDDEESANLHNLDVDDGASRAVTRRHTAAPVKNPPPEPNDALPIKPLIEQLTFVRRTFRDIVRHYTGEIESEILRLAKKMTTEAEKKKPSRERVHEMRDVLMLLREVDVNPVKGRRRDLKKIEGVIKDIGEIVDRWK
jgi:hypothetical protein